MKKQDIKIGKRYKINSFEADGVTPWSGIAEVLEFSPPNFPKRTVLALCEDGVECCFAYNEFVEEHIPTPQKYIAEISKLSKQYGYSISHEDTHGSFIIEPYDENNIDWLKGASIKT
jgi:hypothetical protein